MESADAYFAWRKEADERLKRLREVVAKGLAELEEKRRREAHESS